MNKHPVGKDGKHSIMKLSEHFDLAEFTASETADKLRIDNSLNTTWDAYIVGNLENLCKWVLEPIRHKLGCPVFISSGYRNSVLNERVGGSKTSDHRYGLAADIYFEGFSGKWFEVVVLLVSSTWIPFDQLIIYRNFLHIGIGRAMRREVLDYRDR